MMILHGQLLEAIPLLAMLIVAAGLDLRDRRIPNWLTFSLLIAGLFGAGFVPWYLALAGAAMGFALMLPQFALSALSGGDVKLMMAVGSWLGPWPTLQIFAFAAIAGMLIVISQAIVQGRVTQLVRNSAVLTINLVHLQDVGADHVISTGTSTRALKTHLPYAVPILLGAAAVIFR